MKKRLHSILMLLSGMFLMANNTQSQTVELSFNLTENTLTHTKLSGFNTGPTFNEMFEPSPTLVSIVDDCSIFDPPFNTFNDYKIISLTPKPDLVNKTAEIKPSTLRFPGGTIANFYHIYEYSDGTYDPDSPVFAPGCGTQDIETSVLGGVIREQYCKKDQRVILDDPTANPNYIDGFVNYVLAVEAAVHETGDTDYKMDVIYVPNIFAHFESRIFLTVLKEDHLIPSDPSDPLNIADPTAIFELYYKECIDAIDYLVERDINLVGIEFGNELFFPFYQTANSNVTPETYMDLCEIYAARIQVEYPDIKFAVLSEPSNPTWNNTVAAHPSVFYDAVSLHDYYTSNACIDEGEACPDGCPDDYTTDRTCRFDCGKCALGDYTRHELKPEFEHALEVFPEETKLWFTEWGIISPGTYTGNNLDYMNTFLYSCFVQEHLLQQLEFNAENNNRIEYSTHHRIGYHNRWSVIQARLGQEEATIQSNFYTYKFFEKLALAAETYHYDGISMPDLIDSNTVTVNSFIVKNEADYDPKILIYYSNKTTADLPLNLLDFETSEFNDHYYLVYDNAKTSYLIAADSTGLYSSFGETKFNDTWYYNDDDPSLLAEEDLTITLSDYALPALSTGVIEINLERVGGLGSNANASDLFVYPNPGNELITIRGLNQLNVEKVSLLSLSGKEIRTFSPSEISSGQLNIAELSSGLYLIKVESEGAEELLKFIKH